MALSVVLLIERTTRGNARYHNVSARRRAPPQRLRGLGAALAFIACAAPLFFGFVLPVAILGKLAWDEGMAAFHARTLSLVGNTFTLAGITAVVAIVAATVPEATEGISYGMPAFRLRGHPLVGYANWKGHCALYGMSAGLDRFAPRLEAFSTSKGTIRFTPTEPIPRDLIEDIVRFRVGEIDARWPA